MCAIAAVPGGEAMPLAPSTIAAMWCSLPSPTAAAQTSSLVTTGAQEAAEAHARPSLLLRPLPSVSRSSTAVALSERRST